jgi:hypothetical protein
MSRPVSTARPIARSRYDGRPGRICGTSLMYTVIETGAGNTRLQIQKPTLTGES